MRPLVASAVNNQVVVFRAAFAKVDLVGDEIRLACASVAE
jgi:hypothetical protein